MLQRLIRLVYSNKSFAILMLLIQIAILAAGTYWLRDYMLYLHGAYIILTAVLVIYEVNRTENPTFKITWLLLIALVPIFGMLLYVYTRFDISSRAIRHSLGEAIEYVRKEAPSDNELLNELKENGSSLSGTAKFLSDYGSSPVFTNSAVKYYSLGDYMFKDMLDALKSAEKFIFLEFFIINREGRVWPEILSILKEKVKQGVEVRVIYDGMGCLTTLPRYYEEELNSLKIKCRTFLPVQPLLSTYQNNRDHRKIMVIDGNIAFTGGINLADEYANYIERFGHWKDTGVRITGSAAAGFTGMFLQIWNGMGKYDQPEQCRQYMRMSKPEESEGIVIPFSDSPLDEVNVGMRVYIDMINHARHHINITTPYLVLDDELYNALRYAVQRGVDVTIIMPHIPDKKYAFWLARTYYPQLLKSGVKIYEYSPGFVHSKMLECDGINAVVGTVNFDYRSLFLHHECGVFMCGVPEIKDIVDDVENTLQKCSEITIYDYKRFNIFEKFIGRVIRLIAPLL